SVDVPHGIQPIAAGYPERVVRLDIATGFEAGDLQPDVIAARRAASGGKHLIRGDLRTVAECDRDVSSTAVNARRVGVRADVHAEVPQARTHELGRERLHPAQQLTA